MVGVRSIELDPGARGAGRDEEATALAAPAPVPPRAGRRPVAPAPVLPGRETFAGVVRVVYLLQPA